MQDFNHLLTTKPHDIRMVFVSDLHLSADTAMLNQAFFVFHPDKSVTSNLFQSDESKTFEIANNILSMSGQEAFKMEIVDFKRDTMQLEGKMGDFDMQFMLVKAQ